MRKPCRWIVPVFAIACLLLQAPGALDGQSIITTAAGAGIALRGAGGPATSATLFVPGGVAFGPSGSIYIADRTLNMILKVSPSGILSLFAGTGAQGPVPLNGDGGPATDAALNAPWSVTVDSSENVYIAELGNNAIRKVNTEGIISTVAGGNLDCSQGTGDGGPALQGCLSPVSVAVDGFGNLFIADAHFNRVRKVDTHGIITTVAGSGQNG
jgi:hypothetical protein